MARSRPRTGARSAAKRPRASAARAAAKRSATRTNAAGARRAGRKPAVRQSAAAAAQKARRDPETLRLRAITPSLTVDDLEKSLRFYTDVLGFVVGERWEEGGKLLGVMLRAGACELGLSQDDFAKGRDRKKGVGVRLWCETAQDIDALAARIKTAGGRLIREPHDEMGSRHLWVDDPDGYHLSFSRSK